MKIDYMILFLQSVFLVNHLLLSQLYQQAGEAAKDVGERGNEEVLEPEAAEGVAPDVDDLAEAEPDDGGDDQRLPAMLVRPDDR